MKCFSHLRNVHDKMADGKRKYVVRHLTDHQLIPPEHWWSTFRLPRRTSQGSFSFDRKRREEHSWTMCYVREKDGHSTERRFARARSRRNRRQKIQIPRHIRRRTLRISLCKRNFKTSLVIDSRWKLWGRRWWWNRRRRQESSTQDSWSMSGDFINQHHAELRLKLYDPDNETFPIPLKYVDVMRQTQTSLNNVSEQIIN